MRLFIIRHGETDSNLTGIIQGHLDIDLNERGKAQAKALAGRFLSEKIDYIYSSDLLRAASTAKPILDLLNIQVRFRSELRERNYGILQGLPESEYLKSLSSCGVPWDKYRPENAETVNELRERASKFMIFLKNNHMNDSVLLVSHSGTNRIIIGELLGLNNNETRTIQQSNTSVSLFNIKDDNSLDMEYLDCTAHLD